MNEITRELLLVKTKGLRLTLGPLSDRSTIHAINMLLETVLGNLPSEERESYKGVILPLSQTLLDIDHARILCDQIISLLTLKASPKPKEGERGESGTQADDRKVREVSLDRGDCAEGVETSGTLGQPVNSERLRPLRDEVALLKESAENDFDLKVWGSWPRLLKDFNGLNDCAAALGVISGIGSIEPVPPEELAHIRGMGYGMPAEKDKFREIIYKAGLLGQKIDQVLPKKVTPTSSTDPISVLHRICERFHVVADQLCRRHEGRESLTIKDEYDVQDLMHALLRLFFNDVRPEVWTPSYAGGASRMDFLLKPEHVVIETKKTRPGLKGREIGDQLIIDKNRYKEYTGCRSLVCFVYDPENIISNPRGLEADLKDSGDFPVTVFIVPKHE